MKQILIIFILFITSCGFKPIYLKNDQLIKKFNKITLEGDSSINKQIIDELNLEINLASNEKLIIQTNYKFEATSKNSKGQIETYRSIINSQLITKKDEEILETKNFVAETSYNNRDNNFELVKYQNEIKKNLTNKIIEEIILFLNLK